MIESTAAVITVAEKVVKTANEIKKKEMGKLPDEIDELDLLEGGLSAARIVTSSGLGEDALESLITNVVKEIDEGVGIQRRFDVESLPIELDESYLSMVKRISSTHESTEPLQESINGENVNNTEDKETDETDEPQNEKKGGRYSEVKETSNGETHEVHHMPADSTTELRRDDGPAIKMEKDDHRQTASYGASREAKEYRERQRELIEQGKFREALQMDIDDIHDKFGDKYDDAIAEMMNYVDQLEQEGKI